MPAKRRADASRRSSSQTMLETISRKLDELHSWRSAEVPYDGVRGQLPSWMPAPMMREFEATRTFLLDANEPHTVLQWMGARYKEVAARGFQSVPHYPPALSDKLDALNYIKELSALGEERGLKEYLGANAEQALIRGLTRGIVAEVDKRRRVRGGRVRAAQLRDTSTALEREIHEEADRLLGSHHNLRDIPSAIVNRKHRSRSTVLKYLASHPSGHWPAKKGKKSSSS